ncbi:protein rer1 [Anaeramoeba flamelloides]|uniref:Protein rer1 n=1 Tax=Anaeramoeba flamelloides TaxID=1746091 RepID=A0ABQ8XWV0_9EUKA|nr:protein rer1 [Anaeramoeba flamelloides]
MIKDLVPSDSGFSKVTSTINPLKRKYQQLLDSFVPYTAPRWIFALIIISLYMLRVFVVGKFHVVTYVLGIYLLNSFILFLTPRIDPRDEENTDENKNKPILPTKNNSDFKPFLRKLGEFPFFLKVVKATMIAFLFTFFPFFDLPVYYPVLLVYFVGLFVFSMRKEVSKMIKYKYVPFSFGKKKYSPKKNISTTSQYDLSGFGDEKTETLQDTNENEFRDGDVLQPSINNSTISSSIDIQGSSNLNDFSIQRRIIDSNKREQSNIKTDNITLLTTSKQNDNNSKNSVDLNLSNQDLLSQNNGDQNNEQSIVQTKQFQNVRKTKKLD